MNVPEGPSRRELFGIGAAMAATALLTVPTSAQAQRIARPYTRRPKAPAASGDLLLRLVRRLNNGVTEEEITRARSLGFRRYLEYQLAWESIPDSAVQDNVAAKYPNLALTGTGLYQLVQNQLLNQLSEANLYRAAFSKRQLYERMVEFWRDHFTIYYPKVNYLMVVDDREVVRKNALGNFSDMLRASAHSPAMLEYLDNTRSRGTNVNQNYARELMELHTLGVDGGYTQEDVVEVTRCLTGWTLAGRGDFAFDPAGHDFGAKTVLGTTIPAMNRAEGANGIKDGETVLDLLLAHPSTARFISKKMLQWLLQYDPSSQMVTDVAAVFTRTKGDIKSVIRAIVTPANLMAAPAKYKRPYQMLLSALRSTGATVTNAATFRDQLRILGQPLYLWEDPDGYPDNVDWWAGGILQRWNFASTLTALSTGANIVDITPFMTTNTPDGITSAIDRAAFGGAMPANLRQHMVSYLSAAPITTTRAREALALALSSSSFQWY